MSDPGAIVKDRLYRHDYVFGCQSSPGTGDYDWSRKCATGPSDDFGQVRCFSISGDNGFWLKLKACTRSLALLSNPPSDGKCSTVSTNLSIEGNVYCVWSM